tara:strand:- start:17749 stop:18207 length:459 start_codon:yes stop_codon:yes gene_type:complete
MSINLKDEFKIILISIIVVIIDQISKLYISNNYYILENKNIILFTLKFIKNDGAAFNILSGNRIFLSTISIFSSFTLLYIILVKPLKPLSKYGLSFILAGSVGNGIDRILYGYVIDFIKLNYINFPVFNIADLAINIGVIILLYKIFKDKDY